MKANLQSKISDQQVKSFFNDGVVILRNVFDSEWISLLKNGIAKNLSEPGEGSRIWDRNRKGRFTLYDSDNWRRIKEYRKFVFESTTKEIAARLLNSRKVNFFLKPFLFAQKVSNSLHHGTRMNHSGL